MKPHTKRILCALFSVFSFGAITHAANLNLVTTPAHKTIGDHRFVAVKKGKVVEFKATPDAKKPIKEEDLDWKFDGGTPSTGKGNGPHCITYGDDAENQVNKVFFSAKREDTETKETCTTKEKVTCQVLVPKITFDYSRGVHFKGLTKVGIGGTYWSDPPNNQWGNGQFTPPSVRQPFHC